MNLNRLVRLQLLLLFALLQCVAPVAHAHVNGHHADQHVHLAYIDHLDLSDHESGLSHLSVEAGHSSVVSMPPEYRYADPVIAQAVAVDEHLFALREHIAHAFAPPGRQALPLPPYQHPCSQAPPA